MHTEKDREIPAGGSSRSARSGAEESERGELLASARLGELPGGRTALHRADLALVSPEGRVLAVEVELSVKTARRLAAICRGWARARHIHAVYPPAPGPARAVRRAVSETRSEDRITVLQLGDASAIGGIEREELSDVRA